MSYHSVKLVKRPTLEITQDAFNIVTQDIPKPAESEVLVKLSHLSLVPAMRGWMSPDENSYIPPVKPTSWIGIIKRRLTIQGFTMPDHFHRIPEYGQALGAMLGKGELKYRAHVIEGIESATSGINLLFEGKNTGKLIVKL